ncbi:hypothetical protein OH76DRAFT_554004 [Lentinus brumalis]|uniref:Uncharacterized protein n=1 Tax=Lentinus brumalis TaxID=2498619 RepID=A0A371D985_9APHY|nr:hypothetical protein OH76DRAFT_554004 [Polyporus brumalis]
MPRPAVDSLPLSALYGAVTSSAQAGSVHANTTSKCTYLCIQFAKSCLNLPCCRLVASTLVSSSLYPYVRLCTFIKRCCHLRSRQP